MGFSVPIGGTPRDSRLQRKNYLRFARRTWTVVGTLLVPHMVVSEAIMAKNVKGQRRPSHRRVFAAGQSGFKRLERLGANPADKQDWPH